MSKSNSMSWDKAIVKVLKEKGAAMHYAQIADAISEQELRSKEEMGATPAITVNQYLRNKLKDQVTPTGVRGEYILSSLLPHDVSTLIVSTNASEDEEDNDLGDALITAYGRFWSRELFEQNQQHLYGVSVKTKHSSSIDFAEMSGVYLLHHGHQVVYVGQAKHLQQRLSAHLADDKRNRWDNFSWFSIDPIDATEESNKTKSIAFDFLLDTLEALLIETLGPERNKKVGNEFEDKEFEQITYMEYLQRQLNNTKGK